MFMNVATQSQCQRLHLMLWLRLNSRRPSKTPAGLMSINSRPVLTEILQNKEERVSPADKWIFSDFKF